MPTAATKRIGRSNRVICNDYTKQLEGLKPNVSTPNPSFDTLHASMLVCDFFTAAWRDRDDRAVGRRLRPLKKSPAELHALGLVDEQPCSERSTKPALRENGSRLVDVVVGERRVARRVEASQQTPQLAFASRTRDEVPGNRDQVRFCVSQKS